MRSIARTLLLLGLGLVTVHTAPGYAYTRRRTASVISFRTGTGFVVDSSGLMLTCYHVVRGANRIDARMDGQQFSARVVSADPKNDLALLQLRGEGPFPALTLARTSAGSMGNVVHAFGFPLSSGEDGRMKVTAGRVSGTAQTGGKPALELHMNVEPGNSGSPVVNGRGDVVGIVRARYVYGRRHSVVGLATPSAAGLQLLGSRSSRELVASDLTGGAEQADMASSVAYLRVFPGVPAGGGERIPVVHATYPQRQRTRVTRVAYRRPVSRAASPRDATFRRSTPRKSAHPVIVRDPRDEPFRR